MLQSMSPTLASMIQSASGNPNGNMALFGLNGVQAVSGQPAPTPKEMLINGIGFNSPIMQGYYNPYMGFNNNYNNYGINPAFQQQSQFQLTAEDLANPHVAATFKAAMDNHITFEQQLNMQTRIAKRIVECVAVVCDFDEKEKEKMIKSCDPPPLPSEVRRSRQNKNPSDIDTPIKPMKVYVYLDGELSCETDPDNSEIQDYRVSYVSADQLDKMIAIKAINDEKAIAVNAELYKTAPERKTEKAENLIDFFNNYGHILGRAYNDYELRKASISNVTQLYNKDEFLKFMKSNGILGYRDIDNPVLGSYSNPVKFKDSPNYGLADQFNRSPNLAGNAIYDPDSESVTIVAPKFIADRNRRFDGTPNAINSLYEAAKNRFIADISRCE